jgi:hypothetical protein
MPWKTIRPLSPAVSGLGAVMVAPDSAIGYSYSRSRCELYVIKGLITSVSLSAREDPARPVPRHVLLPSRTRGH